MAFVASATAALPAALRRPALAELDAALCRLQAPTRADVHEARKSCKRLRAWLRLLRRVIGEDAEAARILVRDAGRALSVRRDMEVALATLRRLRGTRVLTASQWRALETALRRAFHRHSRGSIRGGERQALDLLRAARHLIERWPPEGLQPRTVLAELRREYRRARKAHRALGMRSSATALHEWRKRTKRHYYQSELLSRRWSALAGQRLDALDDLGDGLGLHHDLEVLRIACNALTTRQQRARRVKPVLEVISHRQHRLARRLLRAGGDLYAQRARAWIAQVSPA